MLAAPHTELPVCVQNKDHQHTPVNTAVGNNVANVKTYIFFTSVADKEVLCRMLHDLTFNNKGII